MTLRPAARLAAVAFLLALLAACGEAPAPVSAPAAAVTVVTLRPEATTLTRELPGRVSPFEVAEVRPQVTGLVEKRLFKEGTTVQAGQALYQLDDATYRADASSAKAALERARATAKAAELTATRIAELAKIDAVSAQDHENALAAQQQAQADVGVARAALERANVVLGHARIVSPITGRIGKSSVTQGALVTANQVQALATVHRLNPIYVDVTLSSTELLQLRKELAAGTLTSTREVPVTILLEDGTPHAQEGKFAFSDLSVDPATGSVLVRVQADNPDHLLLPGMYVRAVGNMGRREAAILVPQEGIARNPKGEAYALVIGADEKVEQRPVQVSRTLGSRWLVESGLAAGDRVIVEGGQKVKPGASVQATERAVDTAAPALPTSTNAG